MVALIKAIVDLIKSVVALIKADVALIKAIVTFIEAIVEKGFNQLQSQPSKESVVTSRATVTLNNLGQGFS